MHVLNGTWPYIYIYNCIEHSVEGIVWIPALQCCVRTHLIGLILSNYCTKLGPPVWRWCPRTYFGSIVTCGGVPARSRPSGSRGFRQLLRLVTIRFSLPSRSASLSLRFTSQTKKSDRYITAVYNTAVYIMTGIVRQCILQHGLLKGIL